MKKITVLFHTQTKHNTQIPLKERFARAWIAKFKEPRESRWMEWSKSSLLLNFFYCLSCLYTNSLRLNNLKTKKAMNAKLSGFVIDVENDHLFVVI